LPIELLLGQVSENGQMIVAQASGRLRHVYKVFTLSCWQVKQLLSHIHRPEQWTVGLFRLHLIAVIELFVLGPSPNREKPSSHHVPWLGGTYDAVKMQASLLVTFQRCHGWP